MGEGEGQGVVGGERDGAGLYMWGLELLFRGGKRIAREIFAHRDRNGVLWQMFRRPGWLLSVSDTDDTKTNSGHSLCRILLGSNVFVFLAAQDGLAMIQTQAQPNTDKKKARRCSSSRFIMAKASTYCLVLVDFCNEKVKGQKSS